MTFLRYHLKNFSLLFYYYFRGHLMKKILLSFCFALGLLGSTAVLAQQTAPTQYIKTDVPKNYNLTSKSAANNSQGTCGSDCVYQGATVKACGKDLFDSLVGAGEPNECTYKDITLGDNEFRIYSNVDDRDALGTSGAGALRAPTQEVSGAQSQTLSCPVGYSGYIRQQRSVLADGSYGAWYDVDNTCSCSGEVGTQNMACPTGQVGSILQQRTFSCSSNGWLAWTTVSNTCYTPCVVPDPQFQNLACEPGYSGTIAQTRAASCPSNTGSPVWGNWNTTSYGCVQDVASTTETQNVPCATAYSGAGYTGNVVQERTKTVTGTGAPTYTSWNTVSNTCVCTGVYDDDSSTYVKYRSTSHYATNTWNELYFVGKIMWAGTTVLADTNLNNSLGTFNNVIKTGGTGALNEVPPNIPYQEATQVGVWNRISYYLKAGAGDVSSRVPTPNWLYLGNDYGSVAGYPFSANFNAEEGADRTTYNLVVGDWRTVYARKICKVPNPR